MGDGAEAGEETGHWTADRVSLSLPRKRRKAPSFSCGGIRRVFAFCEHRYYPTPWQVTDDIIILKTLCHTPVPKQRTISDGVFCVEGAMIRTYKYRLYPSRSQETNLWRVLDACRGLYNMALAERKVAYQMEGHGVSKAELYELGKHYRQTFPYADQVFSQTAQSVIEQVDLAFQAFFRRVKWAKNRATHVLRGATTFKLPFKQFGVGAKFDGRRFKLYGIGRLQYVGTGRLKGKSRPSISSTRQVWYACFVCEVLSQSRCPQLGNRSVLTSVSQRSSPRRGKGRKSTLLP